MDRRGQYGAVDVIGSQSPRDTSIFVFPNFPSPTVREAFFLFVRRVLVV